MQNNTNLKSYIGKKMIRFQPAHLNQNGKDYAHMNGAPLLFSGFTEDGKIKYRFTGMECRLFGDQENILPFHFNDDGWLTFEEATTPDENNPLNKWIGQTIMRISTTSETDRYYVCNDDYILGAASKYHLYVKYADPCMHDEYIFLDDTYTDPTQWVSKEEITKLDETNPLSQWIGADIMRICPTADGKCSFMDYPCMLLDVSNDYMLVKYSCGRALLGGKFLNPNDWKRV